MKFPGFRATLVHVLHLVILLYALVISWYVIFGPFDFTILGARIYLDDWVRPYQIIVTAILLRILIYLLPSEWSVEPFILLILGAAEIIKQKKEMALLAAIFFLAFILRFWALGQGAQDGVFYDDSLDFMEAVGEYLAGNYLFDTGYPNFSSHFTEFAVRFVIWANEFMSMWPIKPDQTLMTLCAVTLNIFYTFGVFVLVLKIGEIIGRKDAAILAVFLLAVSIVELQVSHYYINDVPMSLFAMLGVYMAVKNLQEEKDSNYIWCGVFLAIAFASKFNALLSFIWVGLIFLHLHPSLHDFMKNFYRLFKCVLAFGSVYVLINPMIIVDPAYKLDYTMTQLYYITRGRGLDKYGVSDNTLAQHIKLLVTAYKYHSWAIKGLFDPIPAWLGFGAIWYVAYKYRWRLMYLWASPLIFILAGRLTKPNSAPFHYLNLMPLLLLVVAIGMLDALKLIPSRMARGAIISVMALWFTYQGVQDTSYWTLPPSYKVQHDWIVENLDYNAKVLAPKDLMILYKDNPRKIREIYTGPEKWCYALHRDARYYVLLQEGLPALYPKTHFPSQRRTSSIFPGSKDLAVTEKLFATGPAARMMEAKRFILADEAADKIVVLARNSDVKESVAHITIGDGEFRKKLQPGEQIVFQAPVEGNRTFLFEGRYVVVKASSDRDTVWYIGATHDDIGDILLETSGAIEAVAEYEKSGSAYSLLRTMTLAEGMDTKRKAAADLKKNYPALFATMARTPEEDWTFANLAGWDENVFKSKMTKKYSREDFNLQNIPEIGLILEAKSNIWGPYKPVMKGEYKVTVNWMVPEEKPSSFLLDVATRRVPNNEQVRRIEGADVESGRGEFAVSQDRLIDFPFELMAGQVAGGRLAVTEVNLTIDYFGQLKALASQALAGMGEEGMNGL